MTITKHKVLSIAVASGKIGFVFLDNGTLLDWGLSVKACGTPGQTKCKAEEWIGFYRPDYVVVEKVRAYSRKSKRTHTLIDAVKLGTTNSKINLVEVIRQQHYPNKYDEAECLAKRFPQIEGWLPERRQAWDGESNDAIYFEALSLALSHQEPPANLPVENQ